jgi:hypothetical protein
MIDWHTDDEVDWESLDQLDESGSVFHAPHLSQKHWLFISFSLVILFSFGGLIYWQLHLRSQETAVQIKTELLTLHQTAWQTAVATDIDLFSLFLNPTDRRWFLTQRVLLRENLYTHRAPMGIWLDETAVSNPPLLDPSTVWLSADLQTARVKMILPYLTQNQEGELIPITLVQSAVYQQSNSRWQQVPAETIASFWGRTIINRGGEKITLIYPDRDKQLGRQLLRDLDQFILQLCSSPRLHCTENLHMRLYLSPENDSMLHLARDVSALKIQTYSAVKNQTIYELALPAPTLVGIPVDEAGYEALLNGYASWAGLALIRNIYAKPVSLETAVSILAEVGLTAPPVAGFLPAAIASNPPIPFPGESIHLLCREESFPATVWVYNPASTLWTTDTTISPDDFLATNLQPINNPLTPVRIPSSEVIVTAVPASIRPPSLTITQSVAVPNASDLIFLAIDESDSSTLYLFRQTSEVQFIDKITRFDGTLQGEIAQYGRFLTIITAHHTQSAVTIYDLAHEEVAFYTVKGLPNSRTGWSQDGIWFFILKERAITLLAPAHHYQTVIYHNHGGCTHGSWSLSGN